MREGDLDAALAGALGLPLSELEAMAKALGVEDADRVIATVAALAFLEARAADSESEWRLLAQKAIRWLFALGRPDGFEPERQAIRERLAALERD